jgi:hypothetical protein
VRGVFGGIAATLMVAGLARPTVRPARRAPTAMPMSARSSCFFPAPTSGVTALFCTAAWCGTYRYNSGEPATEIDGRQLTGFVMVGWRFKYDHLEATVFVGPDAQDYKLTPDDHGSRLRGRYYGVRAGVDLWYEPSPGVMAALNTSASTAGSDFSARGAFGWRLLDRLYVGPEAEAFGCTGYRQLRFGLHGTGLKFGAFEWSAGGGWADDSDHRAGAYGHVGVLARY